MMTNVKECIKPISYIKTHAADMMNFVNERKERAHGVTWRRCGRWREAEPMLQRRNKQAIQRVRLYGV